MTENTFSSFAKTLATLQKLTRIEAGISHAVESSKVPPVETRKFLRAETPEQAANTPLFQFFRRVFRDIGLGDMEIIDVERFKHTYRIRDNPVARMYPEIQGKKTCYVTTDALAQVYAKDLQIVNTSEEVECINEGKEACVFEVNLQPLSVYQMVLDRTDRSLVEEISRRGAADTRVLAEALSLEEEDVEYRLDILSRYHIIDEGGRLTRLGTTYSKYVSGLLIGKEEDFPPPWEHISDVTASIAGVASFAEAFSETVESTPIWEVDEREIINLSEEAKKSKGFAELLSKYINKEKSEEEEE
ncbi:MAG: hypothetical protein J7L61_01930 [Thermoplasmata archaeon]|nr:hypothetical protein [Thermoplasmata archaeon]